MLLHQLLSKLVSRTNHVIPWQAATTHGLDSPFINLMALLLKLSDEGVPRVFILNFFAVLLGKVSDVIAVLLDISGCYLEDRKDCSLVEVRNELVDLLHV